MSDRDRAIAALEKAGLIRCDDDGMNWEHPTNVGDGVTLRDDGMAYVTMTVPYGQVPALLSPLTLEDMERILDDVSFECVTAGERGGARFAIKAIRQRLRQRVNGDTCNREEG